MENTTGKKLVFFLQEKNNVPSSNKKDFIMYYERISKKMLSEYHKFSDIVVSIDNKHRFKNYLNKMKKLIFILITLFNFNFAQAQDIIFI